MSFKGLQEQMDRWLASPRALRLLRGVTALLAVFLLLLFVYAAARRLRYPFEVEWIESNVLVSVLRIAHGEGLYVAPTLHYVPYLYAPLYLYLAAALTRVVGVAGHGYAAMRLLSTLSTLGSCGVIYALVMTETRRRIAGIAAAGAFIGSYALLGAFYDVGRVDSLFVFLLLLALLAQRRGYVIVAALLWMLTFQTKQTVLPLGLFILCAEWQRPKRAVAAVATFLVAVGLSVALMNHATDGWYSFYIFKVARGLSMQPRQLALYLPQVVVEPLGIAWTVIVAALVFTRVNLRSAGVMFYLFVSVALYGGIWFVYAHAGASFNAAMPVFALTAVLFGIALSRLLAESEQSSSPRLAALALAVTAMQLFALVYNPGRFVPTQRARDLSQQFVDQLRAMPGDVYVVNHSYDAILAGKQPHAEGEALGAVLEAKLGATSADLRKQLDDTLAAHHYSAMVIDDLEPSNTVWHFERDYPLHVSTQLSGIRYMTSQAQWFLLPCDESPAVIHALMQPNTVINTGSCPTK